MRAQGREIAQQRVGADQEAQGHARARPHETRFAEHVGDRAGQGGIGIVGIAPGHAIGQIVARARAVLAGDLSQVAGLAAQGAGGERVDAARLPVRQHQQRRQTGDDAADGGVDQSRHQQHAAVADLVEAHQDQQRHGGGGQEIATRAGGEEHHAGGDRQQRLQPGQREQLQQGPAGDDAQGRPGDALSHARDGAAIGLLTDEQRGQQDPVALRRMDHAHHDIARRQRHGQPQRVTEQRRVRRELAPHPIDDVAPAMRRDVGQPHVDAAGLGRGLAGAGQLAVELGQVACQRLHRGQQCQRPGLAGPRALVLDRAAQVGQRLHGHVALHERLASRDRRRQALAFQPLERQHAPAAVEQVAVEEGVGQRVVVVVRGTGALVHVLRDHVEAAVARDAPGRRPLADAPEDAFLGRVELAHDIGVELRQRQPLLLDVDAAQGLEQRGLEAHVVAQHGVEPHQQRLHRLGREQCRPADREDAVPRGPGQQQHRALAPGERAGGGRGARGVVEVERRVDPQDQGRIADGPIARVDRPEHREAEGHQRQAGDEQDRMVEQHLHRQRRRREARQRQHLGAQALAPAVVGLRESAGDGAEEQRDHRRRTLAEQAHDHQAAEREQHAQRLAARGNVTQTFPQLLAKGKERHVDGENGHGGMPARCMPPPARPATSGRQGFGR